MFSSLNKGVRLHFPSGRALRLARKCSLTPFFPCQADNMVLNLHDSGVTAREIRDQLENYPIAGLKKLIMVDKGGVIEKNDIGGR